VVLAELSTSAALGVFGAAATILTAVLTYNARSNIHTASRVDLYTAQLIAAAQDAASLCRQERDADRMRFDQERARLERENELLGLDNAKLRLLLYGRREA
jgi:hypothetical protein